MSHWKIKLWNLWPPFLVSGIRIQRISRDFRTVVVDAYLRPWNRNYVGTMFGGSLYALTDPFYMMILLQTLGSDYIVWDQAATIHFIKPGRGRVRAVFSISRETIAEIKQQADRGERVRPRLTVEVRDKSGDLVARAEKVLYVRKKARAMAQAA